MTLLSTNRDEKKNKIGNDFTNYAMLWPINLNNIRSSRRGCKFKIAIYGIEGTLEDASNLTKI